AEEQYMGETNRLHRLGVAAVDADRSPLRIGHVHRTEGLALLVRRRLLGHDDLQRDAVRISDPEPLLVDQRMRIDCLDANLFQMAAQRVVIVLVNAKREIFELLRLAAFEDRTPAMRMTEGIEVEPIANLPDIESEIGEILFCDSQLGNAEDETIKRMDCGHAGPLWISHLCFLQTALSDGSFFCIF